jgi:Mrp family chromosome partitioning ATPase
MFIDMPPGTGDVALTVFQLVALDGIIIVTSPQELVSMIVEKAVKMAEMMHIPVLGLVENMSYFKCPGCGKEYSLFGKSHVRDTAERYGIEAFSRLPVDPELAAASDSGSIESVPELYLETIAERLETSLG